MILSNVITANDLPIGIFFVFNNGARVNSPNWPGKNKLNDLERSLNLIISLNLVLMLIDNNKKYTLILLRNITKRKGIANKMYIAGWIFWRIWIMFIMSIFRIKYTKSVILTRIFRIMLSFICLLDWMPHHYFVRAFSNKHWKNNHKET